MLEDSSALGTIVTLRKEKLQYAYDSLEFNLKDHNFTTLFPDLCKEIKQRLKERETNDATVKATNKFNTDGRGSKSSDSADGIRTVADANDNGGFPHLILIICFCLGALIFHHAYNLEQMK